VIVMDGIMHDDDDDDDDDVVSRYGRNAAETG
jgi:hypothetical protein